MAVSYVPEKLTIVMILAVGFLLASILGYFSQRMRLSPIIGYLLAGYAIGPYSPGFVADLGTSEQLAEIGVILMLFGVGLHFKWQDLAEVKSIAIPGAILQTLVAATFGSLLMLKFGWTLHASIIMGLAIGVASTVVMVRVLGDNHLLQTSEGHIAVGWLIAEDVLTVIVLLMLPTLAVSESMAQMSWQGLLVDVAYLLAKFAFLIVLMLTVGRWCVSYILVHIARMRSDELFTISVLAVTFVIATAAALVFGTSIALGAFIAGMVIGQTEVRHQALANSLPLKDVFGVIFFLSVGMLFNPEIIYQRFSAFMGLLAIILIAKPVAAFALTVLLRHPIKAGLTVGLALAQIGEFSFILSEAAMNIGILPDEGFDLIVAAALITIAINPLLFGFLNRLGRGRKDTARKPLWQDWRTLHQELPVKKAIVVGYGFIGKTVVATLESLGFAVVVIDLNVDTITSLTENRRAAIYGDATSQHILTTAGIEDADLIVITSPDLSVATAIIEAARLINPPIEIIARARYITDQAVLQSLRVDCVCSELQSSKSFKQFLEARHSVIQGNRVV